MKKSLQSLVLLLMALMMPVTATAAYEQLADGVYQDGSTLYISSSVTSLGDLQVNPSEIYCYATIPPECAANTFTGYGAILHVPAAGMVSYFTALYWYNFNSIQSDAIEPLSLTVNAVEAELEIGHQLLLSSTIAPSNATPQVVYWSSTDPSVATVNGDGKVTAVATGECDILATCVDKVAVCHIIVPTMEPPFVNISLNKHSARVLINHTLTLKADSSPIDVDLAVTSSNPGVAIPRLVNGCIMVVGVSEGTADIIVSASDGWGEPDTCEITVYTNLGDVNRDGYVNISDVTRIIDYLLSGDPEGISIDNTDVNVDGQTNISDVTSLIDFLLSGSWPWTGSVTESFTVNGETFKMVTVEGGLFIMGATAEQGEDATNSEMPAHEVSLSSYSIGETEVTQALWTAVMGDNPSKYKGDLNHPVEMISWDDCQTFVSKLNELTGKNFRLPTEAEWEYAARGGIRSKGYKYSGSDTIDEVAWYFDNLGVYGFTTQPVATKAPNELGIYDMSGNVCEWIQDWYGNYSSDYQNNPIGPLEGSDRQCRGGFWGYAANGCRVSYRGDVYSPWYCGYGNLGMRLARDINSTNLGLSEYIIEVILGHTKGVDILNGNGNYSVTGGTDYVSCRTNENSLIVTGQAVGTTIVYLTDLATDTRVQLKVNVKDNKEVFTVRGKSFTMMAVEGGRFTMGANDDDTEADSDEKPAHEVTLSSFYIGETEMTQELWKAVMNNNPSYNKVDKCPVERVSRDNAQVFINTLNQLTGEHFRLPTEAEWEYAARGGNKSQGYKYAGSNKIDDVAWYNDSNTVSTHIVKSKVANELGLYDMSGNVREWCVDGYGPYGSEAQTNPIGTNGSYTGVLRGGSFYDYSEACRISDRISFDVRRTNQFIGFRLARDVNP